MLTKPNPFGISLNHKHNALFIPEYLSVYPTNKDILLHHQSTTIKIRKLTMIHYSCLLPPHLSSASCTKNVLYSKKNQSRTTCCTGLLYLYFLSAWTGSDFILTFMTGNSWRLQDSYFVRFPSNWVCLMFFMIRFRLCISLPQAITDLLSL